MHRRDTDHHPARLNNNQSNGDIKRGMRGCVVWWYHHMNGSFGSSFFQQADDGPDVIATDPLATNGRIIALIFVIIFGTAWQIGRRWFVWIVFVSRRWAGAQFVEARLCPLQVWQQKGISIWRDQFILHDQVGRGAGWIKKGGVMLVRR